MVSEETRERERREVIIWRKFLFDRLSAVSIMFDVYHLIIGVLNSGFHSPLRELNVFHQIKFFISFPVR